MGKIELPVDNETRPKKDSDEKRKRKRIPMERKGGLPQDGNQQNQGIQNRRPGGGASGAGPAEQEEGDLTGGMPAQAPDAGKIKLLMQKKYRISLRKHRQN